MGEDVIANLVGVRRRHQRRQLAQSGFVGGGVCSPGELPAGTHRLGWDGSTLSGTPAARGVYLARLVAGERVEVQKVLLER